ncbi:MAG: acyltransferase family protein [Humidesulfovibrio sp.]|nr:acyltransferase family protein [Humidesulfovibrio sp.]
MEYRKEIDGLRAVAILGVLFYHLRLFVLSGGYLGVDVFFVISGFLISSLLFAEAETTGSISISNFYLRRSRRILPALFVVLSVTFIPIFFLIATTPAFAVYARSIPAAALFVSNIFFWHNSGYFAVEALQSPLLHTWTLGVEEQFYIVIPFVILLLSIRKNPRAATNIFVLSLLLALSFLFCRYGKRYVDSYFIFYMLPTRMWELLTGVVATLVVKQYKPASRLNVWACDGISLAGLAAIIAAFCYYGESTNFAERSLVVVLATALLLIFSSGGRIIRSLLGARPARFIGNISYSMYLWHWPLITIAFFLSVKYDIADSPAVKALIIAATLLLSTLSWKYTEKPLRAKKTWQALAKPLALYASSVLVVCALGFSSVTTTHKPYILDNDQLPTQMTLEQLKEGEAYHLGAPGKKEQFILIGDSHARCSSRALDILAREKGVAGLAATYSNVLPTTTFRNADIDIGQEIARSWLDLIAQKQIKNVVIACNWSALTVGKFYYNNKVLPHDEVIPTFEREFSMTLQKLFDQGCDVWLVEQVPSWRRDPVLAANLKGTYQEVPERGLRGRLFASLEQQVAQNPHLHILDPWNILVANGALASVQNGKLQYFDANHLTQDGARRLVEFFTPVLDALQRAG